MSFNLQSIPVSQGGQELVLFYRSENWDFKAFSRVIGWVNSKTRVRIQVTQVPGMNFFKFDIIDSGNRNSGVDPAFFAVCTWIFHFTPLSMFPY